MCVYVYIYIYIEREREILYIAERHGDADLHAGADDLELAGLRGLLPV